MFCVLSKILYGKGNALRLCALSLSWSGPGFALGPTLPICPNISVFEQCLATKGLWRPQRGMSQVTYVTLVPRVGNETLHPLGFVPCFGWKKWMMYSPGTLLYCDRAGSDVIGCRRQTSCVFVYMLQTRCSP